MDWSAFCICISPKADKRSPEKKSDNDMNSLLDFMFLTTNLKMLDERL